MPRARSKPLREEIEDLGGHFQVVLMPEGSEKQINKKDLTDLLEFLTQRGKYLPLPLTKVATVVTTKGMSQLTKRVPPNDWRFPIGCPKRSPAFLSNSLIRKATGIKTPSCSAARRAGYLQACPER